MTTSKSSTLAAALAYRGAGLSVIPIRDDGSKRPALDSWDEFKGYKDKKTGQWVDGRLATEEELRRWLANGRLGIGVVAGKVSGNLEHLDFDYRADEVFPLWRDAVEAARPGLIERLSIRTTPREPAGYHVSYRCTDVTIPGNMKLAEEPFINQNGKPDRHALIETRGEGGQCLVPGCPPHCHSTGREYRHHSGPKLSQVQNITAAERQVLIRYCQVFDRKPQKEDPQQKNGGAEGWEILPGDD
jgi:hypothetical protein